MVAYLEHQGPVYCVDLEFPLHPEFLRVCPQSAQPTGRRTLKVPCEKKIPLTATRALGEMALSCTPAGHPCCRETLPTGQ